MTFCTNYIGVPRDIVIGMTYSIQKAYVYRREIFAYKTNNYEMKAFVRVRQKIAINLKFAVWVALHIPFYI